MSLTQQVLDRCQARQLTGKDGSPTDGMILSGPKLSRFLTPHVFRQSTDKGFRVRVEWLGRFESGEGADTFALEHDLINKIAEKLAGDAMKKTIIANVSPDEEPIA